jgi:hypothetical protein
MNFAEHFRENYPKEVFSEQDLKIACGDIGESAIYNGISRSLRSGDIVKLKRGHYIFGRRLQRNTLSKFAIANQLYAPSYVSFESALSWHNLIPESVYVTASACRQRKNKYFHSPLGEFSYDFIPCDPFFMGVEVIAASNGHFMMANSVRALFDLVYQRRKKYDNLNDLDADLRIDLEALLEMVSKFTVNELTLLADSYKKVTVKKMSDLLIKELS